MQSCDDLNYSRFRYFFIFKQLIDIFITSEQTKLPPCRPQVGNLWIKLYTQDSILNCTLFYFHHHTQLFMEVQYKKVVQISSLPNLIL